MQQPDTSLPATVAQSMSSAAYAVYQSFDTADLDVGYEGAFPFLTENDVTD